eukprot:41874-Prymnesium_polylepis.2
MQPNDQPFDPAGEPTTASPSSQQSGRVQRVGRVDPPASPRRPRPRGGALQPHGRPGRTRQPQARVPRRGGSAGRQAREALEAVAMKPCNLPGGTCAKQDLRGLIKAELERAWMPWVKDEL